MRIVILFAFFGMLLSKKSLAQSNPLTKIYLYNGGSIDIKTRESLNQPIRVSGYTLVETNLDSLSLSVLGDQFVSVPFERGRTYYFRAVGSGVTTEGSFTTSTEQEFWLNVNAFRRASHRYRHYLLDKESGLKLLEEKR
ncbi:hypothetical protein [uncultured Fibrella sp.]|uniref:hypothetical protein n=1 Tax=uncultured Fibrella sp. TaxID=1284596 RepID=UPI0035C9B6AA